MPGPSWLTGFLNFLGAALQTPRAPVAQGYYAPGGAGNAAARNYAPYGTYVRPVSYGYTGYLPSTQGVTPQAAPRAGNTPQNRVTAGQAPNPWTPNPWQANPWTPPGNKLQLPKGFKPYSGINYSQPYGGNPNSPWLMGMAQPVTTYPQAAANPVPVAAPRPPVPTANNPTIGQVTKSLFDVFNRPPEGPPDITTPQPGYSGVPGPEYPSGGYGGYYGGGYGGGGYTPYTPKPRVAYAPGAPEQAQYTNIAYRGQNQPYRQGAQTTYAPRWLQTPVQWSV